MTPEYLEWKQTLPQVMDWFDRAMEIKSGKLNDRELSDNDLDDGQFIWDEEKQIWR